jgi:hypothetical protein
MRCFLNCAGPAARQSSINDAFATRGTKDVPAVEVDAESRTGRGWEILP